jgi:preprotein translocase subunit SecA
MVQRDFNYAIVDEVDSILVDEARTPLIISGPSDDSSDLYNRVNVVMKELVTNKEHFEKDEKFRTAHLTEAGTEALEAALREAGLLTEGELYDIGNVTLVHHANQSLRAHVLFTRDVDYIVRPGQGRHHRRVHRPHDGGPALQRGLHQALEAKEGVTVSRRTRRSPPSPSRTTSASIPSWPA